VKASKPAAQQQKFKPNTPTQESINSNPQVKQSVQQAKPTPKPVATPVTPIQQQRPAAPPKPPEVKPIAASIAPTPKIQPQQQPKEKETNSVVVKKASSGFGMSSAAQGNTAPAVPKNVEKKIVPDMKAINQNKTPIKKTDTKQSSFNLSNSDNVSVKNIDEK